MSQFTEVYRSRSSFKDMQLYVALLYDTAIHVHSFFSIRIYFIRISRLIFTKF